APKITIGGGTSSYGDIDDSRPILANYRADVVYGYFKVIRLGYVQRQGIRRNTTAIGNPNKIFSSLQIINNFCALGQDRVTVGNLKPFIGIWRDSPLDSSSDFPKIVPTTFQHYSLNQVYQ